MRSIQRTWTRHEIAIQSGHKAFLVLVRRDDSDIFAFFPRKSLRLVLQSLRKRIAPDGVHKTTMNLLSLFIDAQQQPEKKKQTPVGVKKKKKRERRVDGRTSSPLYCSLRENHNPLS